MTRDLEIPNSDLRPPHSLWMPYCQMKTAAPPIEVVATEGVKLHLKDGRTLIDGISSWWTACHGYRHPKIVEAMIEQAQKMPHVMMGGIVHEQAMRLAERLASCLHGEGNRVFLSDSGSVAVEVAMKMAVQFWANQAKSGTTTRNKFVSFQNAYHGDTTGAMSICDPDDSMHANFKGFLLEQFPQPIPDSDALELAFDSFVESRKGQLAAVIIEPLIQMAAGMRFHSASALQRIERICRKHDLLLIVDEVATGFGRTGTMFAHQQAGIHPDIMCVGKGLTGCSVGLAATIATARVYEPFHSDRWEAALMHGPTFMGNPIACSAANASLDLFDEEPRLEQVAAIERVLRERLVPLAGCESVESVHCLGAVGAVRMKEDVDVQKAVTGFVVQGVWIRPIRDTVYLSPAFTIGKADLGKLCDAVTEFVARTTSPTLPCSPLLDDSDLKALPLGSNVDRISGRGAGGEGLQSTVPKAADRERMSPIEFARFQRQTADEFERVMWQLLRNRQRCGMKFRRQHPMGPFTYDFYCAEAKLVIELDGVSHDSEESKAYDRRRDEWTRNKGLRVLRFTCSQVVVETEGVLAAIDRALSKSPSPPTPLPKNSGND